LYETLHRAQGAVDDLIDSGFPHGSVSVLLSGAPAGVEAGRDDASDGPVIVSASGPTAPAGRRRTARGVVAPAGRRRFRPRGRRVVRGGVEPVRGHLFQRGDTATAACWSPCSATRGWCATRANILDTHAPDGFDERAVRSASAVQPAPCRSARQRKGYPT
jgi:hypothetical protein